MDKIKFGTDGWRAVIAKDYTFENIARLIEATAKWLKINYKNPNVVIGYDCRFGGKMFAELAVSILAKHKVKCLLSDHFAGTPMVSFEVIKRKADLGIVITASHNPPTYNGIKLKGDHGGPLMDDKIAEVENLIPDNVDYDYKNLSFNDYLETNMVEIIDMDASYINHVHKNFDIKGIATSKFNFAFDAMYGSGQDVMRKLFDNVKLVHCEVNPSFNNIPPEPLHRNLLEFSKIIKNSSKIDCGLAVDGDADRIALYDTNGNYIDSHHIILLLIHYLAGYKKLSGKIVTGFSSTVKIEKLAAHYGLQVQRVFIGFKDICKVMLKEKVLVGGEESGGISVLTHIPERDGIWMGLLIWQFMIETGKELHELINEIYEITGSFAYHRSDLKLDNELKLSIIEKCKSHFYTEFGKYKVDRLDEFDGFKYFINDDEWVMIRPSGTEPVLRTYAEASTKERAIDMLNDVYKTIVG